MSTPKKARDLRAAGIRQYGVGFISKLVENSCYSRQTVSLFLNGKHVSNTAAHSLYDIGLALLVSAIEEQERLDRIAATILKKVR
jgi:hypothetical protein